MHGDSGRIAALRHLGADPPFARRQTMNHPTRTGFFASRWRGQVSLPLLFWRDMIGVASLMNLAASVGALIAMASGLTPALAMALHFAPLPYNLFLFSALWRHRDASPTLRLAGLLWLLIASLF